MNRPDAILPEPYARYFELRHDGYEDDEIAIELGIANEAMETFVVIAHAKLLSSEQEQP